jgi:hypothetical protein
MKADFSTRRRTGRPRLVDVLLLALGGCALIWSAHSAWRTTRELDRARDAVQALRMRARQEQQRLREFDRRPRKGDEQLARAAVQTLDAPVPRILADLDQAIPAGARLEALTLSYGGEAVELDMRLIARTPEIYDEFVARMERSARFDGLVFGDESRTAEMKVTLRARYREQEGS